MVSILDLPDELLLMIVSDLLLPATLAHFHHARQRHRAIKSLCLSCKTFLNLVKPLLYEVLYVEVLNNWQIQRYSATWKLCHALKENAILRSYVRILYITIPKQGFQRRGIVRSRLKCCIAPGRSEFLDMMSWFTQVHTCRIYYSEKELHIFSCDVLRDGLHSMMSLQNLSLEYDIYVPVYYLVLFLQPFTKVQSMTFIDRDSPYMGQFVSKESINNVNFNNLVDLTIEGRQIITEFTMFLKLCTNLQRLLWRVADSLEDAFSPPEVPAYSTKDIHKVISPIKATLRELTIVPQSYRWNPAHIMTFSKRPFWPKFCLHWMFLADAQPLEIYETLLSDSVRELVWVLDDQKIEGGKLTLGIIANIRAALRYALEHGSSLRRVRIYAAVRRWRWVPFLLVEVSTSYVESICVEMQAMELELLSRNIDARCLVKDWGADSITVTG
jgi:hypothetical protein